MQSPKIHIVAERGWMNDPNGLVFLNGYYHLFYQHNPNDIIWGPMHWGHVRSLDLLHWEHLPIALFPDELGQIFSGSIVHDKSNSSGLFEHANGLVAIYTNHKDKVESQSIAYSNDEGLTWLKYSDNPVLVDAELIDFRDPKVFWMEFTSKWIMTLACGNHIRFYSSNNLRDWQFLSNFDDFYYAVDVPLECPDLFEIADASTHSTKWILKIDVSNHPAHGPGALCILGDFDGVKFSRTENARPLWIDQGQDFYAAVTWSNSNLSHPIWIGWMNNWKYANEIPTMGTRGMMSLPRILHLTYKKNNFFIQQRIPDIYFSQLKYLSLQRKETHYEYLTASNNALLISNQRHVNNEFKISICFKNKQSIVVIYDHLNAKITVDRSMAKSNWSHKDFVDDFDFKLHAPLENFEIVVDTSSFEMFINDGEKCIALQHFAFDFVERIRVDTANEIPFLVSNIAK